MPDPSTVRSLRWLISISVVILATLISAPHRADAVIEPIYTLPFYDTFRISCGFGCYSGHAGTDYELGVYGVGGERVASAASGTAKRCSYDVDAGNYIVLDHGNGHRTRYLHLRDAPLPADGASVGRGQVIGYEGNTGYTNPAGFYHLHFETRHGATTFTCGYDGTAVDPYAASTYLWTVSPPAYSPIMALDTPAAGATVRQPFNIGGWAIDPSSTSGSGIDWVHPYAYPSDSAGTILGPAVFLNPATLGGPRPDVGSVYGSQFNNSGFNQPASEHLADGWYHLVVYAHGAVSLVTIQADRVVYVKGPVMAVDSPTPGQTVYQPFNVRGWAIDRSATSGIGIDWVHVYAYPSDSAGNIQGSAVFLGPATLGGSRPDVGNIYGHQFDSSGYTKTATGLSHRYYLLVVYAHGAASDARIQVNRVIFVAS